MTLMIIIQPAEETKRSNTDEVIKYFLISLYNMAEIPRPTFGPNLQPPSLQAVLQSYRDVALEDKTYPDTQQADVPKVKKQQPAFSQLSSYGAEGLPPELWALVHSQKDAMEAAPPPNLWNDYFQDKTEEERDNMLMNYQTSMATFKYLESQIEFLPDWADNIRQEAEENNDEMTGFGIPFFNFRQGTRDHAINIWEDGQEADTHAHPRARALHNGITNLFDTLPDHDDFIQGLGATEDDADNLMDRIHDEQAERERYDGGMGYYREDNWRTLNTHPHSDFIMDELVEQERVRYDSDEGEYVDGDDEDGLMEALTNRDYFGYSTNEEAMLEYYEEIEEALADINTERDRITSALNPSKPSQFEDEEYDTEDDAETDRAEEDLIKFRGIIKKQGTLTDRIRARESRGPIEAPKQIQIKRSRGPKKRPTGKVRHRNRYLERARVMYEENKEMIEKRKTKPLLNP